MSTQKFDYAYHSGSNCIIAINDRMIADVVGISYNVIDSMAPIYGYSSRLFDAVAPGQKLVQGSFVINYKQPNYIYQMAKAGENKDLERVGAKLKGAIAEESALKNIESNVKKRASLIEEIRKGKGRTEEVQRRIEASQERYWGSQEAEAGSSQLQAFDPTLIGPARLEVFFGGSTRHTCKHLIEIHGVFIIGHGSAIQIDENVILEEYNFIGRDLVQAAPYST